MTVIALSAATAMWLLIYCVIRAIYNLSPFGENNSVHL